MNKTIILIPSYEPDNKLVNLVKEIRKKTDSLDIIIVDDGSGTKYKNIFNQCDKYAKVLSYDMNQGKGFALKYGLEYIKNNPTTNGKKTSERSVSDIVYIGY